MIEHALETFVLSPPHPCTSDYSEERSLAASLAHNVNNVLTGVIGNLELALRVVGPETTVREHLERGLGGACQIADLIRRIVGFALRTPHAPRRGRVSLRQVAQLVAAPLEALANRQGVRVILAGDGAAWVTGDATHLQSAVEQLTTNALEALSRGGRITLRVWDQAGRGHLSLSDNGPGLSAAARDRLFEPFFSTKGGGHLGVGLVVCKEIVEAHGGSIQVTTIPGEGTTVGLTIPCADGQVRESGERETNMHRPTARVGYAEPHIPSLAPQMANL